MTSSLGYKQHCNLATLNFRTPLTKTLNWSVGLETLEPSYSIDCVPSIVYPPVEELNTLPLRLLISTRIPNIYICTLPVCFAKQTTGAQLSNNTISKKY